MVSVALRPAEAEDLDFLYGLNRTTMREYVVETWGRWDERWQEERYRRHFRPADFKIIVHEGQDVGVLASRKTETELVIASIQLLPNHQGRGIGTSLINVLLDEARDEGKQVTLQVLKVNGRARRLYERLGFSTVEETDIHHLMKSVP
jgi:ribosomal protein S18 acetylase RimI-like enzyme